MIVLGISNTKDSGACLMVDGELIAAVNEERFSRVKLTRAFPHASIEWLMRANGIVPSDIDAIATGVWSGMDTWGFFPQYLGEAIERSVNDPVAGQAISARAKASVDTDAKMRGEFAAGLLEAGLSSRRLIQCDHHHAHAITAFHYSPFDKALVVTLDGRGDFSSGSVWIMKRPNSSTIVRRETEFDSLGAFYAWVTKHLGFTPDRHEGKVTGLAAHGDARVARAILSKMIEVEEGRIRSHLGPYYQPYMNVDLPQLTKELEHVSAADIAAAAQERLEDIVTSYIRYYAKRHKIRYVCLSGGIFANVLLNMKIKDLDEVDDICVFPHMGDGGISAGSAAFAALALGDRPKPLGTAYLGPSFTEAEIEHSLQRTKGIKISKPSDYSEVIARSIVAGEVVGLFNGRMEYGPRALGARSILVQATDPEINVSLNHRLSRTEFMPFAPVTLEEFADQCYQGWSPEHTTPRFMTCCYSCKPFMRELSPAVVHVDNTARPQIINEVSNPIYYSILSNYQRLTGIPSIINTSFNRHEEPIILGPDHAIEEVSNGSIDLLAIHPFVVSR